MHLIRSIRHIHPLSLLSFFLFGTGLTALLGHTWPLPLFTLITAPLIILGGIVSAGLLAGMQIMCAALLAGRHPPKTAVIYRLLTGAWLPLMLPALNLLLPGIDVTGGWLLTAGGILLSASFTLQMLSRQQMLSLPRWMLPLAVGVIAGLVYGHTMAAHVGAADTFEFQVTAYSLGIAHPTGYPLYVMLGHLFAWLLPVGSVAWRVNLTAVIPAALTVGGVTWLARRAGADGISVLIGALTLAFSLTFWQAATAAEVYALNALLVITALSALHALTRTPRKHHAVYLLGAAIGLGLAHHLTILLILPAAALTLLIMRPRLTLRQWLAAATIVLAGAALTLYIPLRWPAVTGEMMPPGDFLAYVTGQQFSGALQWHLLGDPERWQIIGRIILSQFGPVGLALMGVGAGILWLRRPLWGMITSLAAAAYLFYGLIYNVPDVAVFMIPAFVIGALWIAAGAAALVRLFQRRPLLRILLLTALALLPLSLLTTNRTSADRSADDGGEAWAQQVFQSVADDAVILADSERIAPLEYLHRVEGLGPELTITVRGDEAGYRESLYGAINAGRPVYLARTLPGLEAAFYLRSAGPVIEVGQEPLTTLPPGYSPLDVPFGETITLASVKLPDGLYQEGSSLPVTLAWHRLEGEIGPYEVRLRLRSAATDMVVWEHRGFAVSGTYPTNAWKPGEIVLDYHEIPLAYGLAWEASYVLEVALFLPYTSEALLRPDGTAWYPLRTINVTPAEPPMPQVRLDTLIAPGLLLIGHDPLPTLQAGSGTHPLTLYVLSLAESSYQLPVTVGHGEEVTSRTLDLGTIPRGALRAVRLLVDVPDSPGNLSIALNGHTIMTFTVQAHPAALANFAGIFSLDAVGQSSETAVPGGTITITAQWTTLSQPDEDYTIFVQAIGPDGRLWGQVDTFPLQGTLPTSAWPAGEIISDRYTLTLRTDAPPGSYRIIIGFYLLRTGERLAVLDTQGSAIGDFYTVGMLYVE